MRNHLLMKNGQRRSAAQRSAMGRQQRAVSLHASARRAAGSGSVARAYASAMRRSGRTSARRLCAHGGWRPRSPRRPMRRHSALDSWMAAEVRRTQHGRRRGRELWWRVAQYDTTQHRHTQSNEQPKERKSKVW